MSLSRGDAGETHGTDDVSTYDGILRCSLCIVRRYRTKDMDVTNFKLVIVVS